MCGIAGIMNASDPVACKHQLNAMSNSLAHRGPDGKGYWHSPENSIYLTHRRLSILDLSNDGAQPLQYLHYHLVYNGEIYNYKELKTTLQSVGYHFKSTGDIEVIPAAFDYWGEDFLHRLDGMFAFALYDSQQKRLKLVRDRFGQKPLYYFANYHQRGKMTGLWFASEMKALWAAGIPRIVNPTMLVNYLGLGMVNNPIVKTDTFYKNILSLPPGYLLDIQIKSEKSTLRRWYQPEHSIGHLNNSITENEMLEQLKQLLLSSVEKCLRSDVPVGTSLSGGLDSSSIVACIHQLKQTNHALAGWSNVCFSAIFPGFKKDESAFSAKVAEHFDLERFVITPNAADLLAKLDAVLYHQEEPMQSSSVFTQYMVYGLAKEEAVSVLLDGQGADEILAGYPKYSHWYLQQLLRTNYAAMQKEKSLLLANGMLEQWSLLHYPSAWLPVQTAALLKWKAIAQLNKSHLHPDFLAAHRDNNTLFKPTIRNVEDLLFFNTFNSGLEELLRYADRNSMAHSIEVRLPFLNHELVEFAFSLPSHLKIRNGYGKWALRTAIAPLLPDGIAWRSGKIGFEPPQAQWLKSKAMKLLITESRAWLVQEKILHKKVLDLPFEEKQAHENANYDWRYLNAAILLGMS